MKQITILIVALSFSISSIAQISITGIVSIDSIPLESASVIIKNSTIGIVTNSKGQFKIEAKKGDTLAISYLGYEPKELVVDQSYYLKVKLEEGGRLSEVVVIAYGTTTKCVLLGCGRDGRDCNGFSCVASAVGVVSKYKSQEAKLYPNPSANGIFQLKLKEEYNEVNILVSNINGQTIQNSNHQKVGEKLTIDLSEVATGIYIINISADGNLLKAFKAIRS